MSSSASTDQPPDCAGSQKIGLRLPVTYRGIPLFAASIDVLLVMISAIIAGSAYHYTIGVVDGEYGRSMAASVFIAALFVAAMSARQLYEPSRLILLGDQLRGLIGTWCGAFLILASGVFTWGVGKDLSRGTILLFWALGGLALVAHRQIWRLYLPKALETGAIKGRHCVVISWDKPRSAEIADMLVQHGYRIEKSFQLEPGDRDNATALSDVISFVRGQNIDDIFLAPSAGNVLDVVAAANALRALPIPVNMIPDPTLTDLVSNPRYELGSSLALEIQRPPLSLGERAAKRLFDIVVASLSLVFFLPLLILIALAIIIDSPGPVFFRQTRTGFNGQPFKIFKFRTMTVAEDGDSVGQATKSDKRITRLGAWLRKTSSDELPQLINVLRGEMSIVGPRPHAVVHDRQFSENANNYVFRHHVKAGMTGWAQVHGARGETDTVEKIQRRTELDLWYVKHWSLALDFSILLRTVVVVLTGKNAY